MSCTRTQYLAQAQSWYGRKESDGSHKEIIDVYNSHTPRARGYKLTYKDPWCAGFISACAIKCNATDIIPLEVSCTKMIALAKKLDIWVEDDNYTPTPGDIIMYDWQDSGKGDNTSNPDHVGVVKEVNGKKLTVTEGNYKDAVKDRTLEIGGKYIRGYIVPKYDTENPAEPVPEPVKPEQEKTIIPITAQWNMLTTVRLQEIFGTTVDGIISNQHMVYMRNNPGLTSGWDWRQKPNGRGSQVIKAMQAWAGMSEKDQDGEIGPKTIRAFQKKLGTKVDGFVSATSAMVKALQEWCNQK